MRFAQRLAAVALTLLSLHGLGCGGAPQDSAVIGSSADTALRRKLRGELVASASSLAFGDVDVGGSASQTMTLTNAGSGGLTLTGITVSGTDVTTTGPVLPMALAPNESTTLTVTFSPTAAGSVTGSITVDDDVPGASLVVGVTGNGVMVAPAPAPAPGPTPTEVAPVATPSSIAFPSLTVGASTTQSVVISNVGTVTVTLSGATVSGGAFTVTGSSFPAAIAPGGSVTLQVTFAPAAAGSFSGSLSVANDAPGSPLVVPVSGTATQPVAPPPPPPPTTPQFFVSTGGSDANPGTQAAPWRTIQKAMNSATAGSTVNIMAGVYVERLTVNVSGSAGSVITFQPSGYTGLASDGSPCGASISNNGYKPCVGDSVVLDYASLGTHNEPSGYLVASGRSYVTIQGLTFQNDTVNGAMQRGIDVTGGSQFVTLRNNRFLHMHNAVTSTAGAFLHFWTEGGSHDNLYVGNEFGDLITAAGEAITFSGAGTNNNTFQSNWVHDTSGIAFDAANGSSGTRIVANLFENAGVNGCSYTVCPAATIYSDGGSNVVIERNLIRRTAGSVGNTDGIGISAETSSSGSFVIRDNVIYGVNNAIAGGCWAGNGSCPSTMVSSLLVTGNTVYGNNVGLIMLNATNAVWKNNIAASNTSANIYYSQGTASQHTFTYNLWYGVAPTWGGANQSNNFSGDPRFTNPAAADFSLLTGSPARDAGDPSWVPATGETDFLGNARVVNGRVDIGAYEAP